MNAPSAKTYIVVMNWSGVNIHALQQYLLDATDILGVWNYLPYVFCVKTRLSATDLKNRLLPFFGTNHYMIAEVNPAAVDGMLPPTAWHWFYAPPTEKNSQLSLSQMAGTLLPPSIKN